VKRALVSIILVLALAGCAHRGATHGPPRVPVDSRPTPPSPAPPPATEPPAVEPEPAPPVAVESVMTPEERRATLERVVADTTAAGSAVRKCGSRKLLPDQESVMETTLSLLDQARAALAREELWRAESLARKARQLAASLDCPG
jgi:hypothetical protein